MIQRQAVQHRIDAEHAYPIDHRTALLRLRVGRGDLMRATVMHVDKYMFLRGAAVLQRVAMTCVVSDELFDYYEASLPHPTSSLAYCFWLEGEDEALYYGNYRFFATLFDTAGVNYIPFMFIMPEIARDEIVRLADWLPGAVVYQIFPDSFAAAAGGGEGGRPFGGTLNGILGRLDYLAGLGVDVIYLNPIFAAGGYHKYNTRDHFAVDADFGNEDDLIALVHAAHGRGMRVVLDGVFSATGVDFFAFRDLTQQGAASPYRTWYDIWEFPVRVDSPPAYRTFGGHAQLPKLNFACEDVCRYCLDVMVHWVRRADIDGWRLDVADEIPHSFWRRARQAVDAVKPGVILVGEVWYDSTSWLGPDQLDSVMNYLFYTAAVDFFALGRIGAGGFAARLGALIATYRRPLLTGLWNLLGSHDTPRFLHQVAGNLLKLKAAFTLQFAFPGVPVIYYGDEIGMTGGHDPHCRGRMIWESDGQNDDILQHVRHLAAARRESAALRRGCCSGLAGDERTGLLRFARILANETVLFFLNASDSLLEIDLAGGGWDLLASKSVAAGRRQLAPWETLVLRTDDSSSEISGPLLPTASTL